MRDEQTVDLALRAEIELFDEQKAGRSRAVRNGFRPSIWLGGTAPSGDPALHSVVLAFDGEPMEPGASRTVFVKPVAFETWPAVRTGMGFDLYDGIARIGRGRLLSKPTDQDSLPQLRRALNHAFEDWIVERFDTEPTRSQALGEAPDFSASFRDAENTEHRLIVNVVPRSPQPADVKRAGRLLELTGASTAVLLALDSPGAATLRAIYKLGTSSTSERAAVPRVRVVTTRDLASRDFELIPHDTELSAVALMVA
jgi:hypothetical protein